MPDPLSLALPTLFFAGAMAGLLAALILLLPGSAAGRDHPGVRPIGWSTALGAASMFVLWLESRDAGAGPVPVAGILALGQAALLLQGCLALFGGRQPAWLTPILLAAAAPAYAATLLAWPPPASFLLIAGLHAGFCGLAAFHALRARERTGRSFRIGFGSLYGLLALLTVARVADVLAGGIEGAPRGVYTETPLHEAAALVWALSPLLTALTVLGMLNARMSRKLLEQALTDELTGVHTRRHLLDEAPRMLARQRAQRRRGAVMMLDLDHFKRINDDHGHRAGDLVLRRAALTMRRALRADSLLARYGGEEFCAVVPVHSEADAAAAAERVRLALSAQPVTVGKRQIRLTVSIGLAVQRGDLRFDELLAIADDAVYQAKARGRNCVAGPGVTGAGVQAAVSPRARPRPGPRARPA